MQCSSMKADDIDKAYIERHFYGTQEMNFSEGFEANLHHFDATCTKNPGHKQFIPAIYFNIDNLPDDYRDDDLVAMIRCTCDLTVRISVNTISSDRPEFWPGTDIHYPLYNKRGTNINRTGTGIVWLSFVYHELMGKGTCQCSKCLDAKNPSKVWGEVGVYTAKHVVFDSVEANKTSCRLFFDTPDSELVKLDGWDLYEDNLEEDWCRLKYVTCETELVLKLFRIRNIWSDAFQKVDAKFKKSRHVARLNFFVSHPHGCPKQVSVGHWVKRLVVKEQSNKHNAKYTYTTCTCPCSSGALVHSVGYGGWFSDQVHSGVNFEGVNFSCTGYDQI